jgi:hypothetical protein
MASSKRRTNSVSEEGFAVRLASVIDAATSHQGNWYSFVQCLESPNEVEIAQTFRRYRDSFSIISSNKSSDECFEFDVTFIPSDPDFKFKLENGLYLRIVLVPDYPSTAPSIMILNEDISYSIRRYFFTAFQRGRLCSFRAVERVISIRANELKGLPNVQRRCGLTISTRAIDASPFIPMA